MVTDRSFVFLFYLFSLKPILLN